MKKHNLAKKYFLRYTYGKQIYFEKPTKNEKIINWNWKWKKQKTKNKIIIERATSLSSKQDFQNVNTSTTRRQQQDFNP